MQPNEPSKIKLLHHPMIKLQKKTAKINIIDSTSQTRDELNDKHHVKVSHPVIMSHPNRKKKVYNDLDTIASGLSFPFLNYVFLHGPPLWFNQ